MKYNRISSLKSILGFVLCLHTFVAGAITEETTACNDLKKDLEDLHNNIVLNFSGYVYSPLIRSTESEAYKSAIESVPNCQTNLNYVKSLQGYFATFRDPHVKIWWKGTDKYKNLIETSMGQPLPNSTFHLSYMATGVTLVRYSNRYFIQALDPNLYSKDDLKVGDELVSCEKKSPQEILKGEILPFESVSDIEAALYKYTPNIFFRWDKKEGDSFQCEFKRSRGNIGIMFQWHSVKENYLEGFKSPQQKIYQLEERPYGHLVTLRSLASYSKESNNQLSKFVTDAELLRNDKVIVLDIRGNSGGSSAWGSNWIETLFGYTNKPSTALSMVLSSDKNLAHYERLFAFLKSNGGIPGSATEHGYENLIKKMKLAPDSLVTLNDGSSGTTFMPAPEFKGTILVLTDFNVFSSAEIFVQELKQMPNVVHIGIATNASTFYADLRFDLISSSGLVFSLPTKIMTSYFVNRESGEGIKPGIPFLHNPETEFAGQDSLLEQTEEYIQKYLVH